MKTDPDCRDCQTNSIWMSHIKTGLLGILVNK